MAKFPRFSAKIYAPFCGRIEFTYFILSWYTKCKVKYGARIHESGWEYVESTQNRSAENDWNFVKRGSEGMWLLHITFSSISRYFKTAPLSMSFLSPSESCYNSWMGKKHPIFSAALRHCRCFEVVCIQSRFSIMYPHNTTLACIDVEAARLFDK